MSPQLLKVEEQALLLSAEERETLVERLLRSLGEEAVPKVDPAWMEAAKRRYREYKEGRVEGIPAEQAFEEIDRELGWSG